MDLKNFDWRTLRKIVDPNAANDLNAFLEKLPHHAGQTALIAAGIAWASAGALGLFTAVQLQSLIELRSELQNAKAVNPPVPKIRNVPVDKNAVESFVQGAREIYRGVDIKASGPTIAITAQNTASFPEFREAIGHVQNGGQGWRVNVDKLCVGRECSNYQLGASLKISRIDVAPASQ
ncbi:MAG: hypothetical protein EOM26_03640 [Alphaproteobacteria bacterium]|nr:hypothetical protein [Alphaproteobacteria bacterium]